MQLRGLFAPWVWSGIFRLLGLAYGLTRAETKIVVAYADTTKNGPSTEADTSRTSEFLRVRIVSLSTVLPKA